MDLIPTPISTVGDRAAWFRDPAWARLVADPYVPITRIYKAARKFRFVAGPYLPRTVSAEFVVYVDGEV